MNPLLDRSIPSLPSWQTRLNNLALPALLWLGFILQGGKTPLAFVVWGSAALAYCGWSFYQPGARWSNRSFAKELCLLGAILLAEVFSLDRAASWFEFAQALVFWFVWVAMKMNSPSIGTPSRWVPHWSALAAISIVITAPQLWRSSRYIYYGAFPINPLFDSVWCVVLGFLLITQTREKSNSSFEKWRDGIIGGLAIIMVSLVPINPDRSALIGLAAGFFYWVRPWTSFRRTLVLLALVGIGLASHAAPRLADKILHGENSHRSAILKVAVKAIIQHPATGWGQGNFEMAYQRYAFPVYVDPILYNRSTRFAHNEYLQIGADVGIFAAFIILWGIGRVLWAPDRSLDNEKRRIKAAWIILLVTALTNFVWHLPILLFLTLLFAAMLSSPVEMITNSINPRTRWRPAFLMLLIGVEVAIGWSALRDHWASTGNWSAILKVNSSDADAWKQWADGQSDPALALPGYRRAVELVPQQVFFHEALARALESGRRPEDIPEAIHEYKQAVDLAPSRAVDTLAIGRNLFRTGQMAEALTWFQRAGQTEPRYWEASLWSARVYFSQGNPKRALWVLTELDKRHRDYEEWKIKMNDELPYLKYATPYSATILGYDDHVVAHDRSIYQQALLHAR